jgi:hypothetical protein
MTGNRTRRPAFPVHTNIWIPLFANASTTVCCDLHFDQQAFVAMVDLRGGVQAHGHTEQPLLAAQPCVTRTIRSRPTMWVGCSYELDGAQSHSGEILYSSGKASRNRIPHRLFASGSAFLILHP